MLKLAKGTSYILCQANQLPFPLRPQGARPELCVKNLSPCALSTPCTRKPLKLGSTLFCSIPVNFPHTLSIYVIQVALYPGLQVPTRTPGASCGWSYQHEYVLPRPFTLADARLWSSNCFNVPWREKTSLRYKGYNPEGGKKWPT